MTLSLDATVGGASANSYASVSEANAYFESQSEFFSIWDDLTEQQKIGHLIEATRALERFDYISVPVDDDQALAFPRACQDDFEEIPAKVKQAQMEMLRYRYQTRDASTGQAARDVDMVNVPGKIQIQFSKEVDSSVNQATGGNLDTVAALLREWRIGENSFRIVK